MKNDEPKLPQKRNTQPRATFNWGSLIIAVLSIGLLIVIVVAILTWSATQVSLVAAILVLIVALAFTLLGTVAVLRIMGLIDSEQTMHFLHQLGDKIPFLGKDFIDALARIAVPARNKPDDANTQDSNDSK